FSGASASVRLTIFRSILIRLKCRPHHSDHNSSVAKSLATATSIQTSLTSGCSHSTTVSRSANTRFGDNLILSMQKSSSPTSHIDLTSADGDRRNICEIPTPPLRKQLTTDLISSSSDRITPPVARHRYSHRRLTLSNSARRSRRTSSNFSGPTSVDSLDEDNGVSSDAREPEEQLSVTCSQVDLSEIESRVHSLCSGLRQQESLLSRINRLHGQASKDRLSRLQSTLMQHKQLCTEIIQNIRNQLDTCQSAVRLNTSARSTGESNSPSQTTAQTPHSPKLSVLFATEPTPEQRNTPSVAASVDEDTPVNHNVVSLAEDLVSATDTEGDLQKLGFDEKPESLEQSVRGVTDTQATALIPTEVFGDESESESRTISVEPNHSPLSSDSAKSVSSVQRIFESDRWSGSKLNHGLQTPSCFEISDRLTDVDFDNETFSRTPTSAVDKPALLHHLATLSSTSVSADNAGDVDLHAVKQVLHHVVVTNVSITNGELLSTGEVMTNYQSTRTDKAE
ncbi:uncharacterized protein DEA37_0013342, partial [Paragonimus westermani]